ncbi:MULTISPECIES: hypothetical protein [Chryseobacterium]|uniref:hypothetical protein n=1 Tax=Chryseobacterium TaxID=59732 RepID=UPI0013EF0BD1|nr:MULTISPECIES: hypothetical protein [Chryseobacterium]QQV02424.1 hypothetical protein I6I61_15380 [Chryseobacterium sp. FDAARGOS 1104]
MIFFLLLKNDNMNVPPFFKFLPCSAATPAQEVYQSKADFQYFLLRNLCASS